MEDVERDLYRFGMALTTRHNEVAPCQFECAPQASEANLGCDQNQLLMETLRKMARRHKMALLLHEKPFAGLNGSGKHVNFSLVDSEGRNLLKPSGSYRKNVQFLTFLSALLLGLSKHIDLLRATIASPGNMHRLGGNEAPPAIMSVFLGRELENILQKIEEGLPEDLPVKNSLDLGLKRLPSIILDNTDRNRTAPLAFTGNKFEFRAPGAPQSPAGPLTVLVAIWAWGIEKMAEKIESRLNEVGIIDAALDAIKYAAKESKNIRYEGNCYSDEWVEEAERRGLTIANTTPEALELFLIPEHRELFSGLGIMTDREITAYYDIRLEQYVNTLDIEMSVLSSMIWEGVLPAISRQMLLEKDSLAALEGLSLEGRDQWSTQIKTLGNLKCDLMETITRLADIRESVQNADTEEKARVYTEKALPVFEKARSLCDRSEQYIAHDLWPYPKYRELLQIS
jgi:glutamine synthetase